MHIFVNRICQPGGLRLAIVRAMNDNTIVRMPPSPTGFLHLGTARTALMNWLFRASTSGQMIFRWEDTDAERSKAEFEDEILQGLAWLGMDFVAGSDTFCRQSERSGIHAKYLQQLWADAKVFPCFVTKDELNDMREAAQKAKTGFVFWSPWRDADRAELQSKMDAGEPFVWRVVGQQQGTITFDDAVRGSVETPASTLGDFAVARADGSVLYMLANVIDDATQGITHVIRGEDHISNTPKQVLLYDALGFAKPAFVHIPLVLDAQRKKLSKRTAAPGTAVLIRDFMELGFMPEAVVNGLALTGWHPGGDVPETLSMQQITDLFTLEGVQKGAAQYDFDKMLSLNRAWMGQLELDELVTRYRAWATAHAEGKYIDSPALGRALDILREKAHTFAAMSDDLAYLLADGGFDPSTLKKPEEAAEMLPQVLTLLESIDEADWTREVLRERTIALIKHIETKTKVLLPPWRLAMSGRTPSAGPFDVSWVVGKAETLRRVARTIAAL